MGTGGEASSDGDGREGHCLGGRLPPIRFSTGFSHAKTPGTAYSAGCEI